VIRGNKALEILKKGIEIGPGRVIKFVNPLTLTVDHTYQRGIVEASVDRIRREFDESALGVFEVGQRKKTGILYIVDAQNRCEALRARAALGEYIPKYISCLIHENTTREQEAEKFVTLNTAKPVTGNARFKARLHQSNAQPERTIEQWVHEAGFVFDWLDRGRPGVAEVQTNGIRSISNLLNAYKHCHSHLQPALKLLRLVWGEGDPNKVPYTIRNGGVIYGLSLFLRSQGDKSVTGVALQLKRTYCDLPAIWKDINKTAGTGYSRYQQLADSISEFCGGTRRIQIAA